MLSRIPADNPSTPTKRRYIPGGLESPPPTPQFTSRSQLCAAPPVKANTMVPLPLLSPPGSARGKIVDTNQAIAKHMLKRSENSTTLFHVSPACYRLLAERGVRLRYKPLLSPHRTDFALTWVPCSHTYFPLIDTLLLRPMITPVHGLV